MWALHASICTSLSSKNIDLFSPLNMSNELNCMVLARAVLMYINKKAVILRTFIEPWNLYIDTKRIPI